MGGAASSEEVRDQGHACKTPDPVSPSQYDLSVNDTIS